ncbi:FCGR3 protein, partial [Nycticryphes semicollaris]|nr:FCGR3 protein [Nycticryphes semicollaris]
AGVPCHPAGAQLSQLTLDPPWIPVFRGEKVTLTCQGSGEPGPTTTWWYNREPLQWAVGRHQLHSSELQRGTYQCRSPRAEISPPLTLSYSYDSLVLQVPSRALLEGDELWLRCRN